MEPRLHDAADVWSLVCMMQLMYVASFAASLIRRDIFLFLDNLNIHLSFKGFLSVYKVGMKLHETACNKITRNS